MQLIQSRAAQALLLASTVACSASMTEFSSSDGFGAAGPEVAMDAAAPESLTDCPASLPPSSSTCVAFSAQCEYGWAAEESCNASASCSGGRWSVQKPPSGCVDVCPASYTEFEEGDACTNVGSVCSFYEATCGCVADDDGGVPPAADAGDGGDAGAATGRWRCHVPQDECPARRPRVGEACVKSMTCDYGSCAFGRELTFQCNGYWSLADHPSCP